MWKEVLVYIDVIKPNEAEKFFMSIGGFLGFVFNFAVGGVDEAMAWLLTLAGLDYITGVAAAYKQGKWNSRTGFQGLLKKAFMIMVVALCHGVDVTVKMDMLRNMAIFAYAVNEAGSIIENADVLGFGKYFPKFLRNGLERLKEKHEM